MRDRRRCGNCGYLFLPLRDWQLFCSNACRKEAFAAKKCVVEAAPLSPPPELIATHQAGLPPAFGAHSGEISALRSYRHHGDHDSRDAWARNEGSLFTEEMPAFLVRAK
jgi:hypothetical protein